MKNTMIAFSILSLFTFFSSRAEGPKKGNQAGDWDFKKIAKESLKISSSDVENQLDAMVKSGQITAEQAEKAKAQLSQMDDGDLKRLEKKAYRELRGYTENFKGKGKKNLNRMPANYRPQMKALQDELKRIEKKEKKSLH